MNACTTDGTFKHTGIFDGITFTEIGGRLCLPQFRGTFDSISQIHLHAVGKTIRNSFTQKVRTLKWKLLYTSNIFNGILSSHTGISNNMRTILVSILIHNPAKHLSSSIIIKISIDIRQIDTIRIQETFKQQIILQRIYFGNSKTISYHRTCCRTTARPYHNPKIISSCIDEILNNKEISRKSHCLHDMQLKINMFADILRNRITIMRFCSIIS